MDVFYKTNWDGNTMTTIAVSRIMDGHDMERKVKERKELERKGTNWEKASSYRAKWRKTMKEEMEGKELERKEMGRKELERKEIERKEMERKEMERKEIKRKETERRETLEGMEYNGRTSVFGTSKAHRGFFLISRKSTPPSSVSGRVRDMFMALGVGRKESKIKGSSKGRQKEGTNGGDCMKRMVEGKEGRKEGIVEGSNEGNRKDHSKEGKDGKKEETVEGSNEGNRKDRRNEGKEGRKEGMVEGSNEEEEETTVVGMDHLVFADYGSCVSVRVRDMFVALEADQWKGFKRGGEMSKDKDGGNEREVGRSYGESKERKEIERTERKEMERKELEWKKMEKKETGRKATERKVTVGKKTERKEMSVVGMDPLVFVGYGSRVSVRVRDMFVALGAVQWKGSKRGGSGDASKDKDGGNGREAGISYEEDKREKKEMKRKEMIRNGTTLLVGRSIRFVAIRGLSEEWVKRMSSGSPSPLYERRFVKAVAAVVDFPQVMMTDSSILEGSDAPSSLIRKVSPLPPLPTARRGDGWKSSAVVRASPPRVNRGFKRVKSDRETSKDESRKGRRLKGGRLIGRRLERKEIEGKEAERRRSWKRRRWKGRIWKREGNNRCEYGKVGDRKEGDGRKEMDRKKVERKDIERKEAERRRSWKRRRWKGRI